MLQLVSLIELIRPLEWSKSLANMVIAALTAAMLYSIHVDLFLFLQGFVSVVLLWSGLYALNDYTDRKADALHSVKKERPIPSGRAKPGTALIFSFALVALSGMIAVQLNKLVFFSWTIMLANQLFYTMKPFEFKKKPVLDLISGSLVNPVFRFYYGWLLFVPAFNAPLAVLLFILGIQFGGYGLYRMMSKSHEKKLGIEGSVVVFGEQKIKTIFYIAIIIGAISYFVSALAVWKQSYILLGIISILPLPLYYNALKKPGKADMKKMYKTVYLHDLLFIAGFVIVFLFF